VKKLGAIFAALGTLLSPSAAAENDRSSIVTGVVSPLGPSASQAGQKAPWIGAVTLVAWRSGDGPVEVSPLRIEHSLDESADTQKSWMQLFRPRTVVRFRISGTVGTKGLLPFANICRISGHRRR
jgi:hypothetical protein